MYINARELLHASVKARDGDIGTVKDLYFDDHHWTIRYFVVRTGTLLSRHKVLLGPEAINRAEWPERTGRQVIAADLTQEQVRNSPSVEGDRPVSRQQEEEVRRYFGWPGYWGSAATYAGVYPAGGMPLTVPPVAVSNPPMPESPADIPAGGRAPAGDPHLRSVHEVSGYAIAAADGAIGHVEDFLIDDRSWKIDFIVVDTRNWLPGRKTIIAPGWIQAISWTEKDVVVRATRAAIQGAPAYEADQALDPGYVARLADYYSRPAGRTEA